MRPFAVAILVGLALAAPGRAGIYSPNEPFLFELDENGYAKPIQFSGGFDSILAGLREAATRPLNPGDPPNQSRRDTEDRVNQRKAKPVASLTAEELAGLTADLIRLGQNDEVFRLPQPIARDRVRGGFLAYAHLARAHAGRGEWDRAFTQHQSAIRDFDFPTTFVRLTKPQLAWLKRVEREYYLPFLARRAEDARRGRVTNLREDVDALFPTIPPPRRPEAPVRFVGENGDYTAGALAEAERKKLPPDALAIVQQLVLWHPQDARLYWLLGELYNAEGNPEVAAGILEICSFAMGYTNPIMMEHRRLLKAAVAEQAARVRQQEEEEKERRAREERDYQKRFWWVAAIGLGLALILVYYQARELVRRVRRRRGG